MSLPRVLLDENIPRKLKHRLAEVANVSTVPEEGWSGIKNGELLKRAAIRYSVLITLDRGIKYQQSLEGLQLSILLLRARSSKYVDILPLVPELTRKLSQINPGEIYIIGE